MCIRIFVLQELCNVPKFVIDGSCEDLIEGELGNKWFIAACASLACHRQLFNKVSIFSIF